MIVYNDNLNQINFLDERFYEFGGEFYPSATHILDCYPKGAQFIQWLKDMGSNASEVVQRAAEFGSAVHDLTDRLEAGDELKWVNEDGSGRYSLDVWKHVLLYKDFRDKVKADLLASEVKMLSKEHGFAGTIDRVFEMGGKTCLIDLKTSNAIRATHWLQIAAYAVMWNENHPDKKIDKVGVLWTKANIRTDKVDWDKWVFQGSPDAGAWQLKFWDGDYMERFKVFQHVHALWKEENPNPRPKYLVYPASVKI